MITLQKLLERRHLLLDTGVLIEFHKNQESSPELSGFFADILSAPCGLITIDQVYCEFLNYAKDKKSTSIFLRGPRNLHQQ